MVANKILLMFCGLLLFPVTKSLAMDWEYRVEMESFSFSEPIPVSDIIKDNWKHSFKGGNHIFTHNHFLISAQSQNWSIKLQQRYDYYANFHPDTAELVYLDKNHLPVPANRNFISDLSVNQLRATGIGAAYKWQWSKLLDTSITVNYWQPDLVTNGQFQGNIQTAQDASFEGEIQLDYIYTEDVLFERPKIKFSGQGMSIDWQLGWHYSEKIHLSIVIKDVYNRFNWKKATYTKALVTSNTSNFDENGYINFTPSLMGKEGTRNHRQKLPAQFRFDVSYKLISYDLIAQIRGYDDILFYRFGTRFNINPTTEFRWYLDPGNRALTAGISGDNLEFEFTLDTFSFNKAHLVGLNLIWQF